jgi:hypothetical protein
MNSPESYFQQCILPGTRIAEWCAAWLAIRKGMYFTLAVLKIAYCYFLFS